MEQEYWKDIAGFGGMYRISSFGRVMSEYGCGCRQMKTQMNNYGQKVVMLFDSIHGKAQTKMIGRMVAEHFVPNPEHHRFIRFLDGNPLNCHASNIIWASKTVSQEEQYRNSRKGVHQYTRDGKYLKTFPTMRKAVREVTGRESSSAPLSRACHNGMLAYGFQWRLSAEFPAGENICPAPECHVLQADLKTGEILREFPDTDTAAKWLGKSANSRCIARCCYREKASAYGYRWFWKQKQRGRKPEIAAAEQRGEDEK